MTRVSLSPAGACLLRSLIARTGLDADRIIIGRFHSVDWQSLTFDGERHQFSLRLAGPEPASALAGLRDGLTDAEWQLDGYIVADIVIIATRAADDGALFVDLEALTLSE